jgi:hypothetical protein
LKYIPEYYIIESLKGSNVTIQENDSIERPVSPPEGTESMFLKLKL